MRLWFVMRLLVVEDDRKMAALLRRGLGERGAAVDVAANGEDALWMASASRYDAMVLDVMLPGIDGFETCRRLRADGVWTPVLLLTARDGVGIVSRASMAVPTTTWSSRSRSRSSRLGCARSFAVEPRSGPRSCEPVISAWIRQRDGSGAATTRSS